MCIGAELEETTKIEQDMQPWQRDYHNAHTKHMEVMNKLLESRIGEGMEESQKAEKFTLSTLPHILKNQCFRPV